MVWDSLTLSGTSWDGWDFSPQSLLNQFGFVRKGDGRILSSKSGPAQCTCTFQTSSGIMLAMDFQTSIGIMFTKKDRAKSCEWTNAMQKSIGGFSIIQNYRLEKWTSSTRSTTPSLCSCWLVSESKGAHFFKYALINSFLGHHFPESFRMWSPFKMIISSSSPFFVFSFWNFYYLNPVSLSLFLILLGVLLQLLNILLIIAYL